MNYKEIAKHISETNRSANQRVAEGRIHKAVAGEILATPKLAKDRRHAENLSHFTGRFHTVFYWRGIPQSRETRIIWKKK